jgi:hypothetical protein
MREERGKETKLRKREMGIKKEIRDEDAKELIPVDFQRAASTRYSVRSVASLM